jgi:hypothetical protein
MRKIAKYKSYIKLLSFSKNQFPERILKFKRPKWKKLQNILKKSYFPKVLNFLLYFFYAEHISQISSFCSVFSDFSSEGISVKLFFEIFFS